MADDREFRIRPGRIRSTRAQQARPFIAQALAAAKKAGGGVSRSRAHQVRQPARASATASGPASRPTASSPRAHAARSSRHAWFDIQGAQYRSALISTICAAMVSPETGEKARLFGLGEEEADGRAFAERCEDDRHHFRFIVSPDDALETSDLRSFTSDLVGQMEKDLGTELDWVAVDHWNTEHPHVHLIVRGVRDDGEDLVIARDYIKEGMRDRARDLVTQELGPRTDLDIRRTLESQIETERWTQLDRQLVRDGRRTGVIDLAPKPGEQPMNSMR